MDNECVREFEKVHRELAALRAEVIKFRIDNEPPSNGPGMPSPEEMSEIAALNPEVAAIGRSEGPDGG